MVDMTMNPAKKRWVWLERSLLAVITFSVATIAWALFNGGGDQRPHQSIDSVPGWRNLLSAAVPGDSIAVASTPATVVVLSDLECPYCRDFHRVLWAVQEAHPGQVSLAFVHFPLGIHPHALEAARAVECAAEQHRSGSMIDAIFSAQDSLGVLPWDSFAIRAAIPSIPALMGCLSNPELPLRVAEGRRLADSIRAPGTPTVFVNEWQFAYPPSREELTTVVEAVIAGTKPKL